MPTTGTGKQAPRVSVIGAGEWGRNLVRSFHALGALESVCDVDDETLNHVRKEYRVATTKDYDAILSDPVVDAVVIATPAASHHSLAKRALEAGKDVFVEKPLALNVPEGKELVDLADTQGAVLMIGHILGYHPAIMELKRLIRDGELGRIQYIYCSRLNLGKLRTDENILWKSVPDIISVILGLLDELPVHATAQGGTYLNPPVLDTTLSTLEFHSGVKAHIFVSWLHPLKEQRLCVIGSEKMVVFDDLEPVKKLVLSPYRINWLDRKPVAEREGGQVIPISKEEPLLNECEHFLGCLKTKTTLRTNSKTALDVLEVLDACVRSLNQNGTRIPFIEDTQRYFVHPTAVIDQPCQIGDGTKIWHFSHIMQGSVLGPGCNLGQNVVISPGVLLGRNVKVQNNVSVSSGVELQDDVLCGSSMVFTNVNNPASRNKQKNEHQRTLVKRGAMLGANSTVVCGTTIGKYAFVDAGTVVTRDIPDYAHVMGVPATQVGWVCPCGLRLRDTASVQTCKSCGKTYKVTSDSCSELLDGSVAQA